MQVGHLFVGRVAFIDYKIFEPEYWHELQRWNTKISDRQLE